MYGFLIGVYIFAFILLVAGALAWATGIRFLLKAKENKKKMDKNLKILDQKVKDKYNRIALLSIPEFDSYMTKVFSISLELASQESVSEKDPNAAITLYAKTLEKVRIYLGDEMVHAIDYFYGKDYWIRWCEYRFNLLNTRKYLPSIITKTMFANNIERELNQP